MSETLRSFNPADGSELGSVYISNHDDINKAVVAAKKAARNWKLVPIQKRLGTLEAAYSAISQEIPNLAKMLSMEMGKDIRRATGEVQGTVYGGPYIAESVSQALKSTTIGRTRVEYVPLGVVAIISPWNYPLAMANNLLVPALIAGNSVLWKPSEETPLIAQEFYELLSKNLPQNLIQIIHGDGKQGRMLVESEVNMIAFTGSQAVGKEIMRNSASNLKRLVMELGGNDPMIVMADADIEAAARFAVASSFENSGQMCTSTERIYVDSSIAEEFEKRVVAYAQNYSVGPWDQEGVNIGPIINSTQHSRIVEHLNDAKASGANILLGSEKQTLPYIQPTVITGIKPEMTIEQEETFGPVVCIDRYTSIDEAVERANNSSYGLGGVVFGQKDVEHVADQLEAGMVGINQGVGGEGDSPWVGAKQSGFGFHGSPDGHKQFAQVKIVNN